MIEGLKPYAEYKESGHRSLGHVPSRWALLPLCRVATPKSECGRTDLELLSVYLHRGVIRYSESGGQVHKPSTDLSKYQVVQPGDFVLNNQQAWRGSIGVSKYEGIISPAYVVMKLSPTLAPGYANYLFRSPAMIAQYVVASRGVGDIQRNLYYPDLRCSTVIVPPPDEQAVIVRFLDHANRKIDGFIRAKLKLIGLLNEQKQAIIHRAVTLGLHPDVPLKPSGIPWLGDIPQHWEVVRSRRLFTVRTDLARPDDVQLSATQSYGVIPQADYEAKIGRRVVKISMHLEKRRHVEKDDFVISMRSFQGGIERAWASGAIRSSYVVMKPDPSVDVSFFSYVLKSPGYIRALQATGDFIRDGQDLTYGNFRMVDLPLMPLPEQKEIAAYIESATKALEASIARTEREIALMQEYRTRLTADLVTGKLDVREAAAKLPEVDAEPTAEEALEENETEMEEEAE